MFQLQPDDTWTRRILEASGKESLETKNGKIQIPVSLEKELIQEFHAAPTNGHQGVFKTWKQLTQYYDVSQRIVADAIKDCYKCLSNKPAQYKPYRELQLLPIPQ